MLVRKGVPLPSRCFRTKGMEENFKRVREGKTVYWKPVKHEMIWTNFEYMNSPCWRVATRVEKGADHGPRTVGLGARCLVI